MRRTFILALAVAGALLTLPAVAPAKGRDDDSRRLRQAVTLDGLLQHERKLQQIANANLGHRMAATVGYDQSVAYVMDRLKRAGYYTQLAPFDYPDWREESPPVVQQTQPAQKTYVAGDDDDSGSDAVDVISFRMSGSGTVTGQVVPTNTIQIPPSPTPGTSTSGCDPSDFPAAVRGKIALIQRGFCPFVQKINNAKAAGATAVLLFNEGQPNRTAPEFFDAPPHIGIPVLFANFRVGQELYAAYQANPGAHPVVSISSDAETLPRRQDNVIAETRGGDPDRVVLLGAHLDSLTGPGINDNGSGVSALLEIAEELAEMHPRLRNQVKFAFWGAEEAGLVGSTEYVEQLTAEERSQIMLNLNFDMIASPNFVRFVYDGDTSSFPPPPGGAPPGSGEIERVFNDYFRSQNMPTEPTAFDGRSDYGPFIAQGIPAGGLFTGAEVHKTPAQVGVYGGVADQQYDPCYHATCDTLDSIVNFPPGLPALRGNGVKAFDQNADAAAHATWTFAQRRQPMQTAAVAKKRRVAKRMKPYRLKYRGPYLNRAK